MGDLSTGVFSIYLPCVLSSLLELGGRSLKTLTRTLFVFGNFQKYAAVGVHFQTVHVDGLGCVLIGLHKLRCL